MAGQPSERGISQGPEIKPFSEISPEDIARRTGGVVARDIGGSGFPIKYDKLAARLWIGESVRGRLGEEKKSYLVVTEWGIEHKYDVTDSEVVLEEDAVTFVHPIHPNYRPGQGVLHWVRVSQDDITFHIRSSINKEQYPNDLDPLVAEAAKRATKRSDEQEKYDFIGAGGV